MKKWLVLALVGSVTLAGAWAQEEAAEESAEEAAAVAAEEEVAEVTLTGEIAELSCYLKDKRGEDHTECAITCAENGLPIVFISREADDKEVMYQVLFEDGTAPIDVLIDFVGQEVDMVGKVVEKAGAKIIIASDVLGADDWLPGGGVGSASTQ